MIPRYCKRAQRCSYGRVHQPCDIHENCDLFLVDTEKHIGEWKEEKKQRPKYGNKKVVINGDKFDSQLEARRYFELKLLERAGLITDLERQKKYVLIEKSAGKREISYVADFVYKENGTLVVEDTKSEPTKTRTYKLKKRLLFEKYGIEIKEITNKGC